METTAYPLSLPYPNNSDAIAAYPGVAKNMANIINNWVLNRATPILSYKDPNKDGAIPTQETTLASKTLTFEVNTPAEWNAYLYASGSTAVWYMLWLDNACISMTDWPLSSEWTTFYTAHRFVIPSGEHTLKVTCKASGANAYRRRNNAPYSRDITIWRA